METFRYVLDKNLTMDSIKRTKASAQALPPVKKLTPIKKLTPVQKPYRDMKIPFGKHKGELLADIPNSYLLWILEQEFYEEKFHEHWSMTKQELEYRKKFNIYIE